MCKFNAVSLLVYEDCTPGLPHSISVLELSVCFLKKIYLNKRNNKFSIRLTYIWNNRISSFRIVEKIEIEKKAELMSRKLILCTSYVIKSNFQGSLTFGTTNTYPR